MPVATLFVTVSVGSTFATGWKSVAMPLVGACAPEPWFDALWPGRPIGAACLLRSQHGGGDGHQLHGRQARFRGGASGGHLHAGGGAAGQREQDQPSRDTSAELASL